MIEKLFMHNRTILSSFNRPFKRYFLKKHALKNRFSIIAGQRGVGKTTAMIQYIYSFIQEDILSKQALYVPVDHFMVVGHSLYEIAEEFVNYGGQLLCLDEIHKYPNWSRELKIFMIPSRISSLSSLVVLRWKFIKEAMI